MKIEEFKKDSEMNCLFNDFWKLTEMLYNDFYQQKFLPGRMQLEETLFSDYLGKHDTLFARNLCTSLQNQLERDRSRILTSHEFYQQNKVYPYIFSAYTELWNLLKAEINGDENHMRTEKWWDEVIDKTDQYVKSQFFKELAKDLALSFLTELEDRDREERKAG